MALIYLQKKEENFGNIKNGGPAKKRMVQKMRKFDVKSMDKPYIFEQIAYSLHYRSAL